MKQWYGAGRRNRETGVVICVTILPRDSASRVGSLSGTKLQKSGHPEFMAGQGCSDCDTCQRPVIPKIRFKRIAWPLVPSRPDPLN